jgi:hypothetical protein
VTARAVLVDDRSDPWLMPILADDRFWIGTEWLPTSETINGYPNRRVDLFMTLRQMLLQPAWYGTT